MGTHLRPSTALCLSVTLNRILCRLVSFYLSISSWRRLADYGYICSLKDYLLVRLHSFAMQFSDDLQLI